MFPTDIEIAQAAPVLPIKEIAEDRLGIPESYLIPYGHDKAKVRLDFFENLPERPKDMPDPKLVLVTAMSPTPAGEGKTTTVVGIVDALSKLGHRATGCLREPSLGPSFGVKGGAAGGGYAQVIPMEDINLHFTGDLHAIGAANNLLSALVDNKIHRRSAGNLDPRRVLWRRVLDINDRSLRHIVLGLGGPGDGVPREGGFDCTASSEVMAAFCLATDLTDLKRRLGEVCVGQDYQRGLVFAKEFDAQGAMATLLKDAIHPNLVQTLEHNPVLIHGGPFANIAHGCSSLVATKAALRVSDVVVTEAGFGSDLGAEKFFDIKCRKGGLKPDAVVIVASLRAIKFNGGVEPKSLGQKNQSALKRGFANLARHIDNVRKFGMEPIVAMNRFPDDTVAELETVQKLCRTTSGVTAVVSEHHAHGGDGAMPLAEAVWDRCQKEDQAFRFLYGDHESLWNKARIIAQSMYGAEDIIADKKTRAKFKRYQELGYGDYPVCIAKTHTSFSTDPKLLGAPNDHVVPVRDAYLATGAGFLVVLCGDVLMMPGLPAQPAASKIDVDGTGRIHGLF